MSNQTVQAKSAVIYPPPYAYHLIATLMLFVFMFALVENYVVLSAFIKHKKLRTAANLWIVALIVCDLLIVINAFPVVIIGGYAGYFVLGDVGCKWDGFIVTVLGASSIYLLTGLSIHRYIIMYRSGHSVIQSSVYKVVLGIIACFLLGLVWGVLPLVGWGTFELEGIGISCAPNWSSQEYIDLTYTASIFILVLLVPVLVIGFCYIRIIYKVWREKQQASNWIKQRRVVKEINVTVSVALIILSFLISWLPYAIISACESFFGTNFNTKSPFIVQFPCLMAKSACIWNPIVYVARNRSFRNAVLDEFPCLKKRREARGERPDSSCENANMLLSAKLTKKENEVSHRVNASSSASEEKC